MGERLSGEVWSAGLPAIHVLWYQTCLAPFLMVLRSVSTHASAVSIDVGWLGDGVTS
jgi:hypothetical protein